MKKRQWSVLQTLTVVVFIILWILGLTALGLTFQAASNGSARASGHSAAVASPTANPTSSPTATPIPSPTFTPSPTCTPRPTRTPRPTYTPRPTATSLPTDTPSPIPTAVVMPSAVPAGTPVVWPTLVPGRPTPTSTLPIPPPVSPVPVAADAINIVVLGSDQRPDWSEWHTDAVHVISIQTDRAAVSVISIPRDLYVYIPGFWMSRINFADYYGEAYGYQGGGPGLVRDTLLYNLGIRVDHYVRTDFDGLIGIINALGGVDIPVHCRLTDYWPYPDENGEYPILTLEPGVHHMDGETALWYARSRKTTSVFSRDRRQQQVLQAVWHKVRDAGMLSQIPSLWDQLRGMVVTDMSFDAMVNLARVAFVLQEQNVRFYSIGASEVTPWVTPHGGNVFLPRWEAIQPIVAEAMAPIPEARLSRTFMPVQVWNGTPNEDWDLLAVDRLLRAGFPAEVATPDRRDYAQTQVIVFSEYAKGTGVGYIQQMFNIPNSRVTYRPEDSPQFGFRLILGADYQTCP